MNIIHYLIGLPPYRKGGATIYAADLLEEQSKIPGIQVAILLPGNTLYLGNRSKIKRHDSYKGIPCFTIQNPVIEPLMDGIKRAEYILDNERYFNWGNLEAFYQEFKPDIIHLHTLMGMPKVFLQFMKSKGTKIVMTSHDYFGLCPRVNLMNKFNQPCEDASGKFCEDCNSNSKSKLQLTIVNSTPFLRGKKYIPKAISKRFKPALTTIIKKKQNLKMSSEDSFVKLHDYYYNIIAMLDGFHFNSEVAKRTYSKLLKLPYNEVIPITNHAITDRRKRKEFANHLRLSFIGGLGPNKGFPILRNILIDLNNEGVTNWELNQWGTNLIGRDKQSDKIFYRGRFNDTQLEDIYQKTDLLVVPSMWDETFSFVALEGLSFGVPVLMSDKVGAQLLIRDLAKDFIFHDTDGFKRKLKEILNNPKELRDYNQAIIDSININFSENKHAQLILDFYKKIISK